jgi:hypothetical protein
MVLSSKLCPSRHGGGQPPVTRHRRQFLPGTLGGDGAAVHRPGQRMSGAGSLQADGEDLQLARLRYFVYALGLPDNGLAAHAQVSGERTLPRPAVGDAGEP